MDFTVAGGSTIFCLGALLGIPLGYAMGLLNWAYGWFDPIVEFMRPVPPLALIPLMIMVATKFQLTDTATVGIILIGFLIDIGNRQLKSWLVSWKGKA